MNLTKKRQVAARLARLTEKHDGVLLPEHVVKDARRKTSPLHDLFEWNDTAAAQKYRLQQARRVITSVRVDIKVDRKVISTVGYVHNPESASEPGYVPIAKLIDGDKAHAIEAIRSEFKRIAAGINRARALAAVLDLEEELEGMLATLAKLDERVELMAA